MCTRNCGTGTPIYLHIPISNNNSFVAQREDCNDSGPADCYIFSFASDRITIGRRAYRCCSYYPIFRTELEFLFDIYFEYFLTEYSNLTTLITPKWHSGLADDASGTLAKTGNLSSTTQLGAAVLTKLRASLSKVQSGTAWYLVHLVQVQSGCLGTGSNYDTPVPGSE